MTSSTSRRFVPPHCPNPACAFHRPAPGWRWRRFGYYFRQCEPRRIRRFRCGHCGRTFSTQTFSVTYWLRHPELAPTVFFRVLACSGFRQIARDTRVTHTTIMRLSARLGRHCLLLHQQLRPRRPLDEPLVIDGFESFEFSQYHPIHLHLGVGQHSHFVYAFTDSELRRKGRLTDRQQRRRAVLEQRFGRPRPGTLVADVADLLRLAVPTPQPVQLHSDEHPAYPAALRRLPAWRFKHHCTPSTDPRTAHNPLFPINLADLLIRHNSANHKRETIAFSKRRQNAVERLALLAVWRNYMKPFSERRGGPTPAMTLGLTDHPLTVDEVMAARLFVTHVNLPPRLQSYYRRELRTRRVPNGHTHRLRYAF